MSYENYRLICMITSIGSGFMLLISAILFIRFKIPKIIGELTGISAKIAIKGIKYAESGNTGLKTSIKALERTKLTDKITLSGKLLENPSGTIPIGFATEPLSTDTKVLSCDTKILEQGQTEYLYPYDNTEVFNNKEARDTYKEKQNNTPEKTDFYIVEDITLIHTEERIS